jgi:fructose/tagatose bisphosphate aldolase
VPLVLHGGSGSGDDNLSRCAKEGICKVNIYTDLYLAAMKALDEEDTSSYFKVRDALQKGMNECLEHYFKVFGTRA